MEELPGEDRLQARDDIFDAAGRHANAGEKLPALQFLPDQSTSFAISQKMAFQIVPDSPFLVNGGKG
ncbi:MAG: hypothetical protein K2Y39_10040 [Candidatus Obscuribacterales bacterium]|nr:hypothetical protein [Candidatus Obscuribacterales bacterium]